MSDVVLLADSQPLFNQSTGPSLTSLVRQAVRDRCIRTGCYFGAANGDDPDYFEIARAFFEKVGVHQARHIKAGHMHQVSEYRLPCLVILSGGDVATGWNHFSDSVISSWLAERCCDGSVVMGVSAGAIHLARGIDSSGSSIDFLQAVRDEQGHAIAVAVHEEDRQWPSASRCDPDSPLLCVPMGEAVWCQRSNLRALRGTAFWVRRQVRIQLPLLADDSEMLVSR